MLLIENEMPVNKVAKILQVYPPLPREMKFDEVNPFTWHLINKKAFTIFDKKKKWVEIISFIIPKDYILSIFIRVRF